MQAELINSRKRKNTMKASIRSWPKIEKISWSATTQKTSAIQLLHTSSATRSCISPKRTSRFSQMRWKRQEQTKQMETTASTCLYMVEPTSTSTQKQTRQICQSAIWHRKALLSYMMTRSSRMNFLQSTTTSEKTQPTELRLLTWPRCSPRTSSMY